MNMEVEFNKDVFNKDEFNRKDEFKPVITREVVRRKIIDEALSLRKNKREDRMNKIRHTDIKSETPKENEDKRNEEENRENEEDRLEKKRKLFSNDPAEALKGLTYFRCLTSAMPVDFDHVEENVTDKIISFLTYMDYPDHQYQAAWYITNMLSGPSSVSVPIINHPILVNTLVKLLMCPNDKLRNQIIWALSNIGGENKEYCQELLNMGIYPKIVESLKYQLTLPPSNAVYRDMRIITWALTTFTNSNTFDVLPLIPYILENIKDIEILSNMSYVMERMVKTITDENATKLLDSGVINSNFMSLLESPASNIYIPMLRVYGNLITGTNENTQKILDMGLIPHLMRFYNRSTLNKIKKEVLWIMSNIAAGTWEQITAVLQSGIIDKIMQDFNNMEYNLKIDVGYILTNICTIGNVNHVRYITSKPRIIAILCEFLSHHDKRLVLLTVDSLYKMLQSEYVADIIEEHGLNSLMTLTLHSSKKISKLASKIVDMYYPNH